jgi:hypothetical protein
MQSMRFTQEGDFALKCDMQTSATLRKPTRPSGGIMLAG